MKRKFKKWACAALAAVMVMSGVSSAGFNAPLLPALHSAYAADSYVTITDGQGWLESAWVEWNTGSTTNLSGYIVSYSKDGSNYTQIDDKLIRHYKDGHWRADIVGLAAGSYTVKVAAVNSSGTVLGSATKSVTVTAHDRRGFAFSPKSAFDTNSNTSGGACGAYKADGTLKDNAEIIYITKASDIDTVENHGVTGLSNILQGRNKRTTNPLVVRIIGKIEYSGDQLNGSGYIQIKPSKTYTQSDITIEGIGMDTTLNFGFLLRNAGNVEIRNLALHDFKDDGISLDTANTDIWVHNNEIFYGVQGSGDKAKGDGSTDVKNDSQYVTISYNHYWDGGKCSLCGMKSEGGDNYITYHHNWFDHSDSRHPRIRTMAVHVFNNFYDGNSKYGVGASEDSNAFVEYNYFRNCKYPTLQGSVGCDSDGSGGSVTLEDSNPIGTVKTCGNTYITPNSKWTKDSNNTSSGNGDCCEVTNRSTSLTYTTEAGSKYNNFDTDTSKAGTYVQSISPEDPSVAKTNVEKYAGRTGGKFANGGDFATASGFGDFDDGDATDGDISHDINSTLRTCITNYYKDSGVSSQYVISTIGGAYDSSFSEVPTQATVTTEAQTEATTAATESQTETTTVDTNNVVTVNYNNGYKFTSAGTLTQDASYGGAYFNLVDKSGNAGTAGSSKTVTVSSGKAKLTDSDTTYTVQLFMPLDQKVTSGTITVSGTLTPSVASSGWTMLQLIGSEGNTDLVGIRTNGSKQYGIRVNGAADVSASTTVTSAVDTQVSYVLTVDMTNKKAKLKVGNSETTEVSFTGSYINCIKCVTATGARDLTVGNVTVSIEGNSSSVTEADGDVNLDGSVTKADVSLALLYLAGGTTLSDEQILHGDMNKDGKVTLADAYAIKAKLS